MTRNEINEVFDTKELVWETALGKRCKISELDIQHLSNILWFNEVFNGTNRFNSSVHLKIELELEKRYPEKDANNIRLKWKPLPIPSEIKWIKKYCKVNLDNGDIWWNGDIIGSLSHIKGYNKPYTFKESVLNFVESKGVASFVEIQKFAVDFKFGEGTYDKGKIEETIRIWNPITNNFKHKVIKRNKYRGQYCSHIFGYENYWMKGSSRLIRIKRGTYKVVRD